MYLIHLLLRAAPGHPGAARPVDPARHRTAMADLGVEHLTEHRPPRPGTALLTAFVRARTLEEAESRAGEACWAFLGPGWAVAAVWPGLVEEYYTRPRDPDR